MTFNPHAQPPKTICVDFDGTLCDFAYPGIGLVKQGAKEALTAFKLMGFRIVIYSCRTCHHHYDIFGGDPAMPTLDRAQVREMINWLSNEDIPYDEIDDGSKGKPLADYYCDDKGIRFNNNWGTIVTFIAAREQFLNMLPRS